MFPLSVTIGERFRPASKERTEPSPDRIDPENRYSRQVETRSRRSRVAAMTQSRVFRRRRKSFERRALRYPVTLVTLVTMNRGPFRSRCLGRRDAGIPPLCATFRAP